MNWVDWALVLMAALSICSGIREGLSRSGFGLIAIGVAFLTAAWVYPGKVAGFVVVFVLVICAAGIASKLLGRAFKGSGLNWLDRVLGGALGLANAVLFAVLAVLAVMAFAPKIPRHYVAHSTFAPYALDAAHNVAEVVPNEMKARVEGSYEELLTLLPPKVRKAAPPLPRNF